MKSCAIDIFCWTLTTVNVCIILEIGDIVAITWMNKSEWYVYKAKGTVTELKEVGNNDKLGSTAVLMMIDYINCRQMYPYLHSKQF